MKNKVTFLFAISSLVAMKAQQSPKGDSIREREIKEVVITGQYSGRSIDKSLYKVEVISRADIQRMAVNNIAEVLNQSLNILIIPEKNTGDSKANIMGLGAAYTKILVDNIPLVGDTGLGNNIDLTKINLENVERIEVVKGSMGVEFGNNAVAGVINIITKKGHRKRWNVRGFVQEETVGKEYDWIDYGKGKHIQSLGVSYNISDRWYASFDITRNDFQGYWGSKQGKNYFQQDSRRGYEWQPKEQINPSIMLRYSSPKTMLYYKSDYLLEKINYYNPSVQTKNLGAGERTYVAKDRNYDTERFLHHFNIETDIFQKSKLIIDASYQKQKRNSEDYIFDIPARKITSVEDKNTYYQAETYYSKGTLSHFLRSDKLDVQVGYEGDYTKGFASWSTGSFGGKNIVKDVLNASVFASAELQLTPQWFLRPGVRVNFSDTFKTTPNFSFILKNKINDFSEFRASFGSANRNPTFEELFTYFVDSNHDIQGNENLKPEKSYSGILYYSLFSDKEKEWKLNLDVSTMYLQVKDRIEVATVSEIPLKYKFLNIDSFESWINTLSFGAKTSNFGVNLGVSILGKSQFFGKNSDYKYRYNKELNASVYYNIPKTNTTLSLYYKGIGKSYRITEDNSLGITQYLLTKQQAFSLLDASIQQKFWKNRLGLTLGVRNIFDISEVQNTSTSVGAHGTTTNTQMLFYGRSYFGKISFNF